MKVILPYLICAFSLSPPTPAVPIKSWFQNAGSEWIDRLPSVKVKFGTSGVSVSTGPSKEEIYWMIGYIVVGVVLFIVISVAVGFCIYKLCCNQYAHYGCREPVPPVVRMIQYENDSVHNQISFPQRQPVYVRPTLLPVTAGAAICNGEICMENLHVKTTQVAPKYSAAPYRSRN